MNETDIAESHKTGLTAATLVLLLLGILYLALAAASFAPGMNLAGNRPMQYLLHVTVLLSAFAYLLFAELACSEHRETVLARLAVTFAGLFTLPIVLGRSLGMWYISLQSPDAALDIFNFYSAGESVSRTMELVSWTVLYPISMLFLGRVFYRSKHRFRRLLLVLSVASSACCFAAFTLLITPDTIFFIVGVLGWGVLLEAILVVYLLGPLPRFAGKQV